MHLMYRLYGAGFSVYDVHKVILFTCLKPDVPTVPCCFYCVHCIGVGCIVNIFYIAHLHKIKA